MIGVVRRGGCRRMLEGTLASDLLVETDGEELIEKDRRWP